MGDRGANSKGTSDTKRQLGKRRGREPVRCQVKIRVGLGGWIEQPPIVLGSHDVGLVGGFAGSYHIAEMEQQFIEYVLSPQQVLLPGVPGFPTYPAYERLPHKTRAADIQGNIGEAIAACWATQTLGLSVADLAHVRTRLGQRRKCPDFLMRPGSRLRACLSPIFGPPHPVDGAFASAPEWWPMEAKWRQSGDHVDSATSAAFKQIVTYWQHAGGPGYGVIVVFTALVPQELFVTLLVPANPQAAATIGTLLASSDYDLAGVRNDENFTSRLHGF